MSYAKKSSIKGDSTSVINDTIQYDKQLRKLQQDELIHDQKKRQKRLPAEESEQAKWYQWPESSIKGDSTSVINDTIQYDKQLRKLQQDELIHDQKKRQKRLPAEESEQAKWYQWPGPCSDDNHCPPNLYCVKGSCWHLSNKPIRVQRIHDSLIKKDDEKKSDISHLIMNSLYHSVDDTFTTSRNMVTNSSEFQNSDPFEYTTSSIIATVVIPTTTTTTLHHLNTTKLKTTISNYSMKQRQSTTTNNLIWPSTHKSDLFEDRDNLSKSSFSDLRFSTDSPDHVEYTRQQRFDKPIRIELYLAKIMSRNECSQNSHCGHRMICCRKRWYDLSGDYGIGYFCLPDCKLTKKISLGMHEANGLVPYDIIYD